MITNIIDQSEIDLSKMQKIFGHEAKNCSTCSLEVWTNKKDSSGVSCDKSCDECVFRIMSHDQSELFDDILNFFWFLDRNCFRNALQYVEHWSRQSCRITFQGSRIKNYQATHIQCDQTTESEFSVDFSKNLKTDFRLKIPKIIKIFGN